MPCRGHRPSVVLALILTAVGTSQGQADEAGGKLVDVGGHSLHMNCVGPTAGGPTVILEAGAGGGAASWSKLQTLLEASIRTCAYDRAGTGESEPGPLPRTMKQEVFELRSLLENAQLTGPYILVGHSYGGLLARLFAEQAEKDVVGVVLVDATHESCVLFNLRQNRWLRMREQATGVVVPAPKRSAVAPTTEDVRAKVDYWPEELSQMHRARLATPEPLAAKPLVVIAGTRPGPPPPGTSEEFWKPKRAEKQMQQADLSLLSRNSLLIRDATSGHNVPGDNPELIARAIRLVVESAASGAPLMP